MSFSRPTDDFSVVVDRAFEASSLDLLQVHTPSVHLRIQAQSENDQVSIRGFIPDSSAVPKRVSSIQRTFTARRSDRQLSIVGNKQNNDGDSWRWRRRDQTTVCLEIQVPDAMNVHAESPGGTVLASHLSGEVTLNTRGGSIEAEHLQGELNVRGGGGPLTIQNSADLTLDLHWKGGTVELKSLASPSMSLYSAGAPTRLRDVEGSSRLTIHGAPLTLEEVVGVCKAQTYGGAIRYSGTPTDETNLRAVGKPVRVRLPASHAATLDLSGKSVSIDDTFNFQGQTNSHHTQGLLNGGGPPLHLHAVQSSVHCGTR